MTRVVTYASEEERAAAESLMVDVEAWVKKNPGVDPFGPKAEADFRAICRDHGIDPGLLINVDIPKVGRNEPCPCGSGLKFKKCHGHRR